MAEWPVNRQDESLLPPPRSFRHLVRRRYRACGEQTRRLVDAVAVLGLHAPVADAAAMAELADPVEAMDEAAANDLLRVRQAGGPWSVEFTHPLVRAAVYDALGPARRHALHTAAALGADETAALRHRVAAATGPDEQLAADLTDFAERAQRRFDWKSAAVHLVSASRLTRDPSQPGAGSSGHWSGRCCGGTRRPPAIWPTRWRRTRPTRCATWCSAGWRWPPRIRRGPGSCSTGPGPNARATAPQPRDGLGRRADAGDPPVRPAGRDRHDVLV